MKYTENICCEAWPLGETMKAKGFLVSLDALWLVSGQ
jgi:hypothetical protein